jgi:hypothetical protein
LFLDGDSAADATYLLPDASEVWLKAVYNTGATYTIPVEATNVPPGENIVAISDGVAITIYTSWIDAADVDIADSGALYTGTTAEAALAEAAPGATKTLTNTTYDANGTGNSLSNVDSGNMILTGAYPFTGLLSGGVVTKATATAYTAGTTNAAEMYGGVIYVTGAATITLPAVSAGMSVTVITVGANAVSVDPNASDLMYLDGTALDDGDKATNTSTTGDIIVFTYYDATGWYATSNGWTDDGA